MSFVALIPKNDHPRYLLEYRSISFIASMHKMISKLLALRLSKVLGFVISSCQSSFFA